MLAVISPAKKLNLDPLSNRDMTQPEFLAETQQLVECARELDVAGLRKLMGISEKLAELNVARFAEFAFDPREATVKQAGYIFDGDTYTGLDAQSLDDDAISYAQRHLHILSGLYGLLRPLDGIQAYRLEMGSKLKTPKGKNLYEFWGASIAKALNTSAEEAGTNILLNCASTEYFTSVDRDALGPEVVTPVFLEKRNGTEKVISFHAKKARGAMARFVMEHRIREIKSLSGFNVGGYAFDRQKSDDTTLVFSRES